MVLAPSVEHIQHHKKASAFIVPAYMPLLFSPCLHVSVWVPFVGGAEVSRMWERERLSIYRARVPSKRSA